jgi:hypothetical protein
MIVFGGGYLHVPSGVRGTRRQPIDRDHRHHRPSRDNDRRCEAHRPDPGVLLSHFLPISHSKLLRSLQMQGKFGTAARRFYETRETHTPPAHQDRTRRRCRNPQSASSPAMAAPRGLVSGATSTGPCSAANRCAPALIMNVSSVEAALFGANYERHECPSKSRSMWDGGSGKGSMGPTIGKKGR